MILCDSRFMYLIIWVKGQVEIAKRAICLFNGVPFSYITDERDGCYLLVHTKTLYSFCFLIHRITVS